MFSQNKVYFHIKIGWKIRLAGHLFKPCPEIVHLVLGIWIGRGSWGVVLYCKRRPSTCPISPLRRLLAWGRCPLCSLLLKLFLWYLPFGAWFISLRPTDSRSLYPCFRWVCKVWWIFACNKPEGLYVFWSVASSILKDKAKLPFTKNRPL